MKIQLLSDLHLEFDPKVLPEISADADVIVFAGDVCTDFEKVGPYFQSVRAKTSATILFVLGNHEYYCLHEQTRFFGSTLSDYKNILTKKSSKYHVEDLHILEKDSFFKDDVKFIGTTLWTNYDDYRCENVARSNMADFKRIKTANYCSDTKRSINFITVQEIVDTHDKNRSWIEQEFRYHPAITMKTVVITHHGPSFYCVPPLYKGNRLNGAFYSEMSNVIMREKPVMWLYGHTHEGWEGKIGSTRIHCNPWGYPFESKLTFKENLLLDL
jgi:predicted phosphodiesterase